MFFCGWWHECDIYVGSHRSGQSERWHPLSVAINSNYCSTLSRKRGDTSATTLLIYCFYFSNLGPSLGPNIIDSLSTFFHNERHSFEIVLQPFTNNSSWKLPWKSIYPGPTKIFFSRGVPLDDLVIIEGFIRPSCCPPEVEFVHAVSAGGSVKFLPAE